MRGEKMSWPLEMLCCYFRGWKSVAVRRSLQLVQCAGLVYGINWNMPCLGRSVFFFLNLTFRNQHVIVASMQQGRPIAHRWLNSSSIVLFRFGVPGISLHDMKLPFSDEENSRIGKMIIGDKSSCLRTCSHRVKVFPPQGCLCKRAIYVCGRTWTIPSRRR
jgi:hypothetical protein